VNVLPELHIPTRNCTFSLKFAFFLLPLPEGGSLTFIFLAICSTSSSDLVLSASATFSIKSMPSLCSGSLGVAGTAFPVAARQDLLLLIEVLEANLGYFSYEHFEWAPAVYIDASKESRFAGGGFFSADGFYDFWEYGSADPQPTPLARAYSIFRPPPLPFSQSGAQITNVRETASCSAFSAIDGNESSLKR